MDFSVDGRRPEEFATNVLADFQFLGPNGELFGAFVFEQDGLLAGLDLWSIDGRATPSVLPEPAALRPY